MARAPPRCRILESCRIPADITPTLRPERLRTFDRSRCLRAASVSGNGRVVGTKSCQFHRYDNRLRSQPRRNRACSSFDDASVFAHITASVGVVRRSGTSTTPAFRPAFYGQSDDRQNVLCPTSAAVSRCADVCGGVYDMALSPVLTDSIIIGWFLNSCGVGNLRSRALQLL